MYEEDIIVNAKDVHKIADNNKEENINTLWRDILAKINKVAKYSIYELYYNCVIDRRRCSSISYSDDVIDGVIDYLLVNNYTVDRQGSILEIKW